MNMLRLMDRLPYSYLLIFSCFTFVYGKDEDFSPSCEVGLLVRRGTTLKTVPHQPVTVECPVQHCGKSLNVTWCKLLRNDHCELIIKTANVEMRQKYDSGKHELVSYLTFNNISSHDDGLYRCDIKGYQIVGHVINISVSDLNLTVETFDNNEEVTVSSVGNKHSWLPYVGICVGTASLVILLSGLTYIHVCDWKRKLTYKPTHRQEMSTFTIPDLPKRHDPTTLVMQDHFAVLNDIYFSSSGTLLSTPPLITSGNQPLANKANESQVSYFGVYAEIIHVQSMLPDRKQHMVTEQLKNTEYATIIVS
ncbi:B- and T-lymphocyte attenuator B- and T-lymphocyte-associated protein Precursor [Channa argus]|uniref:B-and T-lymphocyte attenuator B-and T-lymphocyte-associated protein n=1 Tax=Channa argus TaxID=215402 RepID=A0A6G1PXR4_CHAAH|nr:B- and T-lymphocyte attenuator B- and T-lymphocyte-associated protein Precursor [Channa argus]KAK2905974.1 hypothetical protein Q8A73_009917 [Channa argus]